MALRRRTSTSTTGAGDVDRPAPPWVVNARKGGLYCFPITWRLIEGSVSPSGYYKPSDRKKKV
jgi:hypothetical protein